MYPVRDHAYGMRDEPARQCRAEEGGASASALLPVMVEPAHVGLVCGYVPARIRGTAQEPSRTRIPRAPVVTPSHIGATRHVAALEVGKLCSRSAIGSEQFPVL